MNILRHVCYIMTWFTGVWDELLGVFLFEHMAWAVVMESMVFVLGVFIFGEREADGENVFASEITKTCVMDKNGY